MTEVDGHSVVVHLAYQLFAEGAHTSPCRRRTACRVAHLIVAIVAKSNIYHTLFSEVRDILEVVAYGKSILYAQHYRFPAFRLILLYICEIISYRHRLRVSVDDCPYL